jgi:hypothetical protein
MLKGCSGQQSSDRSGNMRLLSSPVGVIHDAYQGLDGRGAEEADDEVAMANAITSECNDVCFSDRS